MIINKQQTRLSDALWCSRLDNKRGVQPAMCPAIAVSKCSALSNLCWSRPNTERLGNEAREHKLKVIKISRENPVIQLGRVWLRSALGSDFRERSSTKRFFPRRALSFFLGSKNFDRGSFSRVTPSFFTRSMWHPCSKCWIKIRIICNAFAVKFYTKSM